jgi:hypothetical protein
MKWVVVTQWVRTVGTNPTRSKPSQQVGSDIHVHTQQWAYEAGWNEEAGRVMEPRNGYSRGKPTVCTHWKAAVLDAIGRGCRTPPGSKSGACLQRGNSGTWENYLSPCTTPGVGDRATKSPGVVRALRPGHEPCGDTTNAQKQARYRDASDERSNPRRTGW